MYVWTLKSCNFCVHIISACRWDECIYMANMYCIVHILFTYNCVFFLVWLCILKLVKLLLKPFHTKNVLLALNVDTKKKSLLSYSSQFSLKMWLNIMFKQRILAITWNKSRPQCVIHIVTAKYNFRIWKHLVWLHYEFCMLCIARSTLLMLICKPLKYICNIQWWKAPFKTSEKWRVSHST